MGQDGSGPDKSTATILPYTQLGTVSTLAGLLDSLVADAHIELGTAPTDLDRFLHSLVADAAVELAADRYGSNGPVYHVNPAIHGGDADLLERVLSLDESATERANRTGRIGGPNVPDVGLTVGVEIRPYRRVYIEQSEYLGWDDTFAKITRRGQYDCLFLGRDKAKIVQSARGGSYRIDLPCEDVDGDCLPCRQYWVDSAVARFKAGLIGDTQLVITATDSRRRSKGSN